MNGWAEEPVLPGVVLCLGIPSVSQPSGLQPLPKLLRSDYYFRVKDKSWLLFLVLAAPLSITGSWFKQTIVVVILESGVVLRQWKRFFSRQGEYRLWLEQSLPTDGRGGLSPATVLGLEAVGLWVWKILFMKGNDWNLSDMLPVWEPSLFGSPFTQFHDYTFTEAGC